MRRTMAVLVMAGVMAMVGSTPGLAEVVGEVATPVVALPAPGALVAAHATPVAPVPAPSAPGARQDAHPAPSPAIGLAAIAALDGMRATPAR